MRPFSTARRVALSVVVGLAATPAVADWLVYRTGGVQEIRGAWEVVGTQVRFHLPSGTYSAVRADEVDLAASAFLSWQIGERRAIGRTHPPVGAEIGAGRTGAPAPRTASEAPCASVRVARVATAETLEIDAGRGEETVHLACLDAPEPGHPLAELSSFGEQAAGTLSLLARPGFELCLREEQPPLVDRAGHRVVYLELPDGRDLGELLIRRGLALVRGGACVRRDAYLEVERAAIGAEVGHWGASSHDLSIAVVAAASELGGGSALPPRRLARGRS